MYTTGQISRSALFGILFNYRGKANGIVNSLKVPSLIFSIKYRWYRKSIAFLLMLPFLLLFNNWGEAQHTGRPTFLLVEKAYCFSATAALLAIFFNYRGEGEQKGIYLKRPL